MTSLVHAEPLTPVADAVVRMVIGEAAPEGHAVAVLLAANPDEPHVTVVRDVLEACRMSRPAVRAWRRVPEEQLTVVSLETPRGILADLYVTEELDGKLAGVRFHTPVPEPRDADYLLAALRTLDPDASVVTDQTGAAPADARVRAVSSLFKVFVLLATLEAVDGGELTLDHEHRVAAEDLSPLSAGLSHRHIGARVTVADLCRLMALQSDNTATDILIELVGRPAVLTTMADCGAPTELNAPLRSMREAIDGSWPVIAGDRDDREELLRARSLSTPVHRSGWDFYAPLTAVRAAMRRLSEASWTPWEGAPRSGGHHWPLLYKGGSAPGVLAAAWCRRTSTGPVSLAFALNCPEPLGAFEELFAFSCAEKALTQLGIR
jgi:beta-lactamase class A